MPANAAPGFGASTVQVAFDHLFSFGSIVGPEGFDVGNLEFELGIRIVLMHFCKTITFEMSIGGRRGGCNRFFPGGSPGECLFSGFL